MYLPECEVWALPVGYGQPPREAQQGGGEGGTYMVDFILNVFAEVADFCIDFWVDKVINKFAKKK